MNVRRLVNMPGVQERQRSGWQDSAVSTRSRGRAPNAEWVLMYRKGLSRDRIAALVEAPLSTVGYHLTIARATDPGLELDHQTAAGRKPAHDTAQGLERMQQLLAPVQETGRYPSRNSLSDTERTLAAWLQRRREDARADTLAQAYRDGLAVLPDWQTPPRAEAEEARWQNRLAALAAYRAAGNDWPRHKKVTGEEHDLGIWLHVQRSKAHRGELAAEKIGALDSAVPGWRAGRQRGRKPKAQTL
jgi:hypothetical protein